MTAKLPPGWSMATLPEIAGAEGLVADGDWVETKDQDPQGTIRLTQLADVGDGRFRDRSDRWINDEAARRLSVTLLQENDVLVARMPDPLGRSCVFPKLPFRAVTAVDVCIVRAPGVSARWLMHFLNAPQTRLDIAKYQAGSTRKRISRANLCHIPLPVPPRGEQERIADSIAKYFSLLDAAIHSLERVKADLERARASVLQAAVEGRLGGAGADWLFLEPSEDVSALEPAVDGADGSRVAPERGRIPPGWTWSTVGALSEVSGGLTKNQKRQNSGTRLPYLRVANVQAGKLDLRQVDEIGVLDSERERVLLRSGDLLVVEGNGSPDQIGRVAEWHGEIAPCVHQNHLIKLRPRDPRMGRWLLTWLLSPAGRSWISSVASSTSGLYTLSISKIAGLPVPVPPLDEARRILGEMERRLSLLGDAGASVSSGFILCGRLRQSILKRAFEGRLVPQDSADEPAVRLLRRLRDAAPAETIKPAKPRRRVGRAAIRDTTP